ncbi:type I restriction enzyme HsdR N-terminal domain-containing protein [Sphingobacterium thalpophilum]|uniref:type I restriction enzyme HsdR N-terminal domain-containing protein n=1 Tax=Sphingobacterium thalpophilum TaxID=259 RepID=UPI0024A675C4|nr:type I restriction enzyme HsdR N-terminal domain-containing protein [Sphingobacterium thalpophilum]
MYLSEDDIRTKVVYEWLRDSGLDRNDISIEYSIRIQLGKEEIVKTKRTDVLVRNKDGKNLFVIEVKKPNHKLIDQDKYQAISYARLLTDGIAPFSLLTNGKDTIIFDSITGEEISHSHVPGTHPYIKNGYRISGDVLKQRYEALEYLITSSEENLLEFCKNQVSSNIPLLKGSDLNSGKKYIPELFVQRTKPKEQLYKKIITKDNARILLIIGKPQQGKTCFVCNSVETYLEEGYPCLFYPAISLKEGLLARLENDFNWEFKEQLSCSRIINKLNKIARNISKPILIFIDGWNEMAKNARDLNDECRRLNTDKIKIILSTTLPSLSSLLIDESDNLTHVAEEINLNRGYIEKFVSTQFQPTDIEEKNIVFIEEFNNEEYVKAISLHEKAYKTKFPQEPNLPKDPFYIRLAAEQFKNSSVPKFTTRSNLIRESIKRKAARRGMDEITTYKLLNDVVNKILIYDTPLDGTYLPDSININTSLLQFEESAILLKTYNKEIPGVDFYYTHDKDYCISIINQKFHELCENYSSVDIREAMRNLLKTTSGTSALLWFFSCPEYQHYIKKVFNEYDYTDSENRIILRLLVSILFTSVERQEHLEMIWLEKIIDHIFCKEEEVEILEEEFLPIVFKYLQSINKETDFDKYEFWIKVLLKYDSGIEDLGFQDSYIGMYFGEEDLRSSDGYGEDMISLFDTELFKSFVLDDNPIVAERAAMFLAYTTPKLYLQYIPQIVKHHKIRKSDFLAEVIYNPCELIISEMREQYYGSMCPGFFSGLEIGDEIAKSEYEEQANLWAPVIRLVGAQGSLSKEINEILTELKYYAGIDDDNYQIDPNQLKLDL